MRYMSNRGGVLILVVIMVMVIGILFVSLSGLTNFQYHQGGIAAQDETAFQVAESGLNYARWRLAHDPTNFTAAEQVLSDQLKGPLGTYTVTFTPPQTGSSVVTITSVGHTANAPARDVTVTATYGIPSLAKYVFITNEDVWYKGTNIHGAVHSNGGIRMDATSDGPMTSAKETYVCQDFHGCHNQTKPGIWGSGGDSALWQFPVPAIDYNGLTLDLIDMKTAAQTAGTYVGPSGAHGYHIIFNADNTYSLYKVTAKTPVIRSYAADTGWQWASHDIASQTLVSSASVPEGGVLYVEDTLWVEGDIRSHITVAAGRFPDTPGTNADIIINGNISYGGVQDGTRTFGAVAQKNVLIPHSAAPDDLILNGAFLAQRGRFGRRYYTSGTYKLRNSITLHGMIASNWTPVTTWADANSVVLSGYQQANITYDAYLLYGPPPFFPTSGEFQFLSWDQTR
jgi:hypothetical protein